MMNKEEEKELYESLTDLKKIRFNISVKSEKVILFVCLVSILVFTDLMLLFYLKPLAIAFMNLFFILFIEIVCLLYSSKANKQREEFLLKYGKNKKRS
jgi:hypothetical protein